MSYIAEANPLCAATVDDDANDAQEAARREERAQDSDHDGPFLLFRGVLPGNHSRPFFLNLFVDAGVTAAAEADEVVGSAHRVSKLFSGFFIAFALYFPTAEGSRVMLIGVTEDPLKTIVAFNVSSNLSGAGEGDRPAGVIVFLR